MCAYASYEGGSKHAFKCMQEMCADGSYKGGSEHRFFYSYSIQWGALRVIDECNKKSLQILGLVVVDTACVRVATCAMFRKP